MAQAKLFKKKRSGGEMNRGVNTALDGNDKHAKCETHTQAQQKTPLAEEV